MRLAAQSATVADTAQPPPQPAVQRLRKVAVCTLLTGLAFLQGPGLTVADSKTDLTVNPLGWLERALHVWYPNGTFGQLQNQAYGYLWPMGPFYLAGHSLGLPSWVVQRLWWALLLCVACLGVVTLAERLAIGTPATRLIAGVAFALSPRLLTEIGSISVEAWPSAVAPWVLVPLVGLRGAAPARPALARSALAVACAGGANATAVLAVVPLAVLLLATMRPVGRRWGLLSAWCLLVAAATAWWVVPLLILGRYSPPFLDYIETAEVTTRITDLTTILRGTAHWLAYYSEVQGPLWPAGWRLATETLPAAATLVVAGLGLVGLARRGMPHRRWLITGLLLGLALVGLGHVGAVDGVAAGLQREFLDGIGSPLRNVHKFDVVLRLPLILGLAHLLGLLHRSAASAGPGWHALRKRAVAVTAAALAAIIGTASPALAGELPPRGGYHEVPGYWREAAYWLDERVGRDHVLVVPAARFPRYHWGSPTDEITQPLIEGSWAVRGAIPLTPPATIRLLDAIESALAGGAGSPGLADLLARSGVRYLLVRSDLNYGAAGTARPLVVRQALERSPGLRSVAAFGPVVGDSRMLGGHVDEGLDVPVRALEVFEVRRPVARVVAYEAGAVTAVTGGPESLLELAAAGLLTPAPTVLAGDLRAGLRPHRAAVTDGLRRREVAFGLPYDAASSTLAADEPPRLAAPAADFLPEWGHQLATVARYHGVAAIKVSTSWSQASPLSGSSPAHQPFAALDGDPTTSWRSAPGSVPDQQWLEVEFTAPRKVPQLRLQFDLKADVWPTQVTVQAGAETVSVDVVDGVAEVQLTGANATRRIRISIDDVVVQRFETGALGLTELVIPELTVERTLVVPDPPDTGRPPAVLLSAAPTVPACFFHDEQPRCAEGVARASEDGDRIDRTINLSTGGAYRPTLWVRPRPGPALDHLLDTTITEATEGAPTVTASSTRLSHPTVRAGAVLDGDPATAWMASTDDPSPWLRLTWPTPRTITGLRLTAHPSVTAARPSRVQIIGNGSVRNGSIGDDGIVTLEPPMFADDITVLLRAGMATHSYDPYTNRFRQMPVGVGELSVLPGMVNPSPDLDQKVQLACGTGPSVQIGGVGLDTAVEASLRDLIELREIQARVCLQTDDPIPLDAGESRLVVVASPLADPVRLALAPEVPTDPVVSTPVRVEKWSAAERHLHLPPHSTRRVLALRENKNNGWQATAGGKTLEPVVVDGWQQGWIVPADVGGRVVLSFTPEIPYRAGLLAGVGLLSVVLVMAFLPTGRTGKRRSARLPDEGRWWLVPGLVGAAALLAVGGAAAVVLAALFAAVGITAHVAGRGTAGNVADVDQRRLRRLVRQLWWLLPVACFALAGWHSLHSGDPHTAAAPQLAALATATLLWLSVAAPSRRRRVPHRSTGRSTR